MTAIEPAAVIDVPGATELIWATTDGKTVWASTSGAILSIDATTDVVTSLAAPSVSGDVTLAIADDGLWMTRWAGNRVYRLDPRTGAVQLSVEVPKAVRFAFVGTDLWVGREDTSSMLLLDRTNGELGRSLTFDAYGVSGAGDLWFSMGRGVKRVDPSSGAVKATISVQDEGNCSISGVFPDNAWVSCFGRDVMPRAATRLDPAANAVATVASLPPCHGGSVTIIDGRPWFVGSFEDAAGNSFIGLLRLDPDTGAVERFVSAGPGDPDPAVVAGGALWIPDEAGHRILRVDLATLAG